MRCQKCGEELPEGARFCFACGAPVEDDMPAPKKLEDPLDPLAAGAVPLVPVAPPPRATRIAPRPARTHTPPRAVQAAAEEGERLAAAEGWGTGHAAGSTGAAAPRETRAAAPGTPDAEDTATVTRRAAAPSPEAAPAPDPATPDDADATAVSPRAKLPRRPSGGRRISGAHVAVAAVCVVAAAVLVVVLVRTSGSWFSPFADRSEVSPQVEPPSDGSLVTPDDGGEDATTDAPSGAPEVKASVEDYSWAELSALADLLAAAEDDDEALDLAARYHLCADDGTLDGTQTKELELSDGTALTMRIAGFRHDARSDGSGVAGISFVAADPAGAQAMNSLAQTTGGWEGSTLRTWMNEHLMGELPQEVADVIVPVDKLTNAPVGSGESAQTTRDALWLLSYSELVGPLTQDNKRASVYTPEGEQYQLFSDTDVYWNGANALLSQGDYWWLRSPDQSNGAWFMCGTPEGLPTYGHKPATQNLVLIGFCL